MAQRNLLAAIAVGSALVAAATVAGARFVAGDENIASKVEDVMSQERAKPRFVGQLGDFEVFDRAKGVPPEQRLFGCSDGGLSQMVEPSSVTLRASELWSPAFETPEGLGWMCGTTGIMLVNNQGLEGSTSDGEDVAMIRGYFDQLPLPVMRDAPRDRLELTQVEGHQALLEKPIEGYPYGRSNIAVIERYPEASRPGIVVFVERAESSERAIEIAAEIMP